MAIGGGARRPRARRISQAALGRAQKICGATRGVSRIDCRRNLEARGGGGGVFGNCFAVPRFGFSVDEAEAKAWILGRSPRG